MPLFEVFIPSTDPDGFHITAKIRAGAWIEALRNGLSRLGDTADVKNVMVDIQDDGFYVTEPTTGRVFRIKEIEQDDETGAGALQQSKPTTAPPPRTSAPPPAAPVAAQPTQAPVQPPIDSAPPPAVKAPAATVASAPPPASSVPPSGQTAGQPVRPSGRFRTNLGEEMEVVRSKERVAPMGRGKAAEARSVEDILGDLFEETQKLYDMQDLQGASNFVLDLAMKSISADAWAVFISDLSANDLYFSAARGPKAEEVLSFRVPMGQGIVGFCAQEGVSLAVSDVNKDPHFYAAISKSLGYDTQSILCSPAQMDGRVFGALELINKNGGTSFSNDEVNVLNFLAHEFADYLANQSS